MNSRSNRGGSPIRTAALAAILLAVLACGALAQESTPTTLITLRTDSTAVIDVLKILADRSGLNIVTGPGVQGKFVTLHMRDAPFEEALTIVCRAAGLGYERIGNSILVADVARLEAAAGMETRVFTLANADAKEAKKALETISTNMQVNAYGNMVIVRAGPSTMEAVAQALEQIDSKPAQVLLEARLIEVNTSRVAELGIDWEKITKWTTVITEGYQGSGANDRIPQDIDFIKLDKTTDLYRQMEAFEVNLDALLTDGAARLLSNTKIVTLNGNPAEIFAGETVPVVITSLQSPGGAGGVFQTVQLEKIDVGVRLNITPRISDDGFITVLAEPEVSRIIAFVGPDDDLPQTSTRRAKTLIRVQDGQKIYIGGLLSEEKRRTIKKVPILGQIPLLGYLFQYRRDETTKLDLVIEITPHIVGDSGTALPSITEPENPFLSQPQYQPQRRPRPQPESAPAPSEPQSKRDTSR